MVTVVSRHWICDRLLREIPLDKGLNKNLGLEKPIQKLKEMVPKKQKGPKISNSIQIRWSWEELSNQRISALQRKYPPPAPHGDNCGGSPRSCAPACS